MSRHKTRTEKNRELALRLRREVVEAKAQTRSALVQRILNWFLGLAARGVDAADQKRGTKP